MMEENVQTQQAAPKSRRLEKSIVITMLLLLATIGVFVGQTYAFFIDSVSTEQNRIQAGNLDIELVQIRDEDQGQTEHTAQSLRMMPGTSAKLGELAVKNAGTLPVYVRIQIETTIIQSEHEISDGWQSLIDCNFKVRDPALASTEAYKWVYHNGYYYYMTPVAPGEKTDALFDTVLFSPAMGNEFMNSQIRFNVICQSVQSGNNESDPLKAWGWPGDTTASE